MTGRLHTMNRAELRATIQQLERDNATYPATLKDLPEVEWPPAVRTADKRPARVMRSRGFLVQAFDEPGDIVRLSVNRASLEPGTLRWREGISWDELQQLKAEAGYSDREAVEIYPPDNDTVNVANLRHLWVLPDRTPFSWKRKQPPQRSNHA